MGQLLIEDPIIKELSLTRNRLQLLLALSQDCLKMMDKEEVERTKVLKLLKERVVLLGNGEYNFNISFTSVEYTEFTVDDINRVYDLFVSSETIEDLEEFSVSYMILTNTSNNKIKYEQDNNK